jgi:plastocyanin
MFQDRGFFPLTSHIIVGDRIEIASTAIDALLLTSAPGASEKIQQTVAARSKASMTFTEPGLYLLYDAATTRIDPKVGQVAAKRSAQQLPLPAYTLVLVTDRNGRELSVTPAQVNIPDWYITFKPWAIVVSAGEPVTFTNNDMDLHIVMPSPEPMLMPNQLSEAGAENPGLWLEGMESFDPITLKGDDGKGALTLPQSGLHHYYCPVHAVYDAVDYTFAPLKSYGGCPFIMDGVIVVQPT